jgi:hypothetical protein
MTKRAGVDVEALERDLRAAVDREVRFDPGTLAAYSTDASNHRQVPIGVADTGRRRGRRPGRRPAPGAGGVARGWHEPGR